MSKLLPRSEHAVLDVRRFFAEANVQRAHDINLVALAGLLRAHIEWAPLVNQNAHVLSVGDVRIISLAERLREKWSARFDLAHEMGHIRLVHPINEIGLCTGESERVNGHRWRYEREAHDWATEAVMPASMFSAWCSADRPTFAEVSGAAHEFRINLRAAGLRFLELSPQPCALVFSVDGRIKWSVENDAFGLRIVKGRALDARSRASRVFGGAGFDGKPVEVDPLAWHVLKRRPHIEIWEHTVADDEQEGATLSWLWHRPSTRPVEAQGEPRSRRRRATTSSA